MFSLIIPYHNRKSFLPRTLQSILGCTQQPNRIILVDNASTDGSAAVCKDFAAAHPELSIMLLNESRKGACAARNTGLAATDTEWVYFFDSDDELSPDYFEEVHKALHENPVCDVVACATLRVFPDGSECPRAVQHSNSVTDQLLSGQLATQGLFLRTDFLRKIGGWNEQLPKWNDWELGLRILHVGARVEWLRGKAYHRIHQHEDSITGKDFASTLPEICKALSAARRIVAGNPLQLFALACRCTILSATLYREGSPDASEQIKRFTKQLSETPPKAFPALFLAFLHRYVRYGGRGGWYISQKILPIIKNIL